MIQDAIATAPGNIVAIFALSRLAYYRSDFGRKDTKSVHAHNLQGHPQALPCPNAQAACSLITKQNHTGRKGKNE
jgi:hypothetical protein